MAWESTDRRLLPLDAAGRYAAETFEEPRRVQPGSLRGGWRPMPRGKGSFGVWTFSLVGGTQVYRLTWTGEKWTVTADILPMPTAERN